MPAGFSLAANADQTPAAPRLVACNTPAVVGKLAEVVEPTMYAAPVLSTVMPPMVSLSVPPTSVE